MKTIIVLAIMGILGYIGFSANKPGKAQLPKSGLVYYYPKANVYYEVGTGQYAYFNAASNSWKETKAFSEEQKLSLGERAIIQKPSSPLWKNNADDRMVYSARLYGAAQNLQQKFREDSLNSLPKPTATVTPVVKKTKPATVEKDSVKTKSGIARFFEKLFKGKKKENKE